MSFLITITKARCPVCDRFVGVLDGKTFKPHTKRGTDYCPNGGKPIPPVPDEPRNAGVQP